MKTPEQYLIEEVSRAKKLFDEGKTGLGIKLINKILYGLIDQEAGRELKEAMERNAELRDGIIGDPE